MVLGIFYGKTPERPEPYMEDLMSVENKVKEIVAEQLNVEMSELEMNKSFLNDLGADSLDIVELVMAMEEEFELEIPDEDAEKIQTVGDAVKYITEHKS